MNVLQFSLWCNLSLQTSKTEYNVPDISSVQRTISQLPNFHGHRLKKLSSFTYHLDSVMTFWLQLSNYAGQETSQPIH